MFDYYDEKIGDKILVDPNLEEENASEGRTTVEISQRKTAKEPVVNAMQKGEEESLEVEEFLEPAEFDRFSRWAEELGFKGFSCTPFTRSSSFSLF